MLDRKSPIPLYYQLAQLLRGEIRSGDLQAGDKLPSERELSQKFGISRMTVRQAVDLLERDGVVVTQHGIGTVVGEQRLVYDVAKLFGFDSEMALDENRPPARVLRQEVVAAPSKVACALGLRPAEQVIVVERLRTYQDRPVIVETNVFRASLCPGLEQENLQEHSLTSLRKKYGLLGSRARHRMEVTVSGKSESALLQVPVGAPLLLTEGETFGDEGQPMEHFRVLYRGDSFYFQFESDGAATLRLR